MNRENKKGFGLGISLIAIMLIVCIVLVIMMMTGGYILWNYEDNDN